MNCHPYYYLVTLAEPHTYYTRTPGKWGVITAEMCLLCQPGTCCHCRLSFKSLCSARRREDKESSIFHQSSVWEAALVVVGAELREAVAFLWVDTITPWVSWQNFSTLQCKLMSPVCLPYSLHSWLLSLPRGCLCMWRVATATPGPAQASPVTLTRAASSWQLSLVPGVYSVQEFPLNAAVLCSAAEHGCTRASHVSYIIIATLGKFVNRVPVQKVCFSC